MDTSHSRPRAVKQRGPTAVHTPETVSAVQRRLQLALVTIFSGDAFLFTAFKLGIFRSLREHLP